MAARRAANSGWCGFGGGLTGIEVATEMPERLAAFLDRPKKSVPFPNRFSELQEFLLSTNT